MNRYHFVSPSQFVYDLSRLLDDILYQEISEDDLKQNFSISSFKIESPERFIIFRFPEVTLTENYEIFSFLSQRLNSKHELCGIIFQKNNYYISLSLTSKGWLYQKASGNQLFSNWAEGCAAAYEMGFIIYLGFYVKTILSVNEPINLQEVKNAIKEYARAYNSIPSTYAYDLELN